MTGAGLDASAQAFAAFAAAVVVCRLVGELLRRRLTEGVLMTGGSLTAAAAGLMLCFVKIPFSAWRLLRFREPGFRLLYRFFSAAPDVLTALVPPRRPR